MVSQLPVSPLLFDISNLDPNKVMRTAEDIERVNPHRGPMRVLDGILFVSDKFDRAVAYKDIRQDEIWAQKLLQNALMIEAAGQCASYITLMRKPNAKFMGFTGVDQVKIHGQAQPSDRVIFLAKEVEFRPRRTICAAQGVVKGNVVFEGVFTGMSM